MLQDLADDALPTTTDERESSIHGAPKYCQIGVDAAKALLDSALEGADLGNVKALVVIDGYVKYGDFLLAYLLNRGSWSTTSFFFGVCENQIELEWVWQLGKDALSSRYKDGTMALPGGMKLKDASEDMFDPIPAEPTLHKLVVGGADRTELHMPVELVKTWSRHPTFGVEFRVFMDNFAKNGHKIVEENSPPPPNASPHKRGLTGTDDEATPNKKAKVDSKNIVANDSIAQPLLHECKLPGKDPHMFCQVRASHVVVLVNKSSKELSMNANAFLIGFGKGAFKLLKGSEEPQPTQYLFSLTSHATSVVFNNAVTTVGKVLATQRESKPDCKVCYHRLQDNADDAKKFSLTLSHKIVFAPSETVVEVSPANIGNKENFEVWTANDEVAEVLWIVRWTAKGLMPVRPVVHLKGALTLPVGKSCMVCGPPSAA